MSLSWGPKIGQNCEEILTYVSSFYPSTNNDKLSEGGKLRDQR